MHQSIATIDSPEFINLQPLDVNPLMSSCEIKVLYIGENRNHSYITKEVASDMAKTLRGAPIVGYYKEEKEDFADHGERVIFDDEGVKFECLTKPYGFVAPDAKVWFQKFEDTDDFGNVVTREYLMTTGYLWTEQYKECKEALQEGRPQSMELDEDSLDGHWSTNNKTGMDFFIINDAIFSKLCILGDDVEPCFEGASVTKPEVSKTFTKVDDTFKKTLYTMMQELKFALEGGQDNMDIDNKDAVAEEELKDTPAVEEQEVKEESTAAEEVQDSTEAQSDAESEFKYQSDKKTKTKCESEDNKKDDDSDKKDNGEDDKKEDKEDDDKKVKSKNSLEQDYEELKSKFEKLEEDYKVLVKFKEEIDNEKKDELINSFYMLSDEDKAEVRENKSKYSLEDIEAKLSVICVRKKVNFDSEDSSKNDKTVEKDVVTTFNLQDDGSSVPAFISALRNTQKSRN